MLSHRRMFRPILPAIAAAAALATSSAARAGESYALWLKHRDAIRKRADVLRYYTFERVSAQKAMVESLAGEREPLRYVGPEPLRLVEGRWPQKQAVRLDKGWFEAKPIPVRGKSFTVTCWFRSHGQGSRLGNGRTNGMIFAQGDGYWRGFRVWMVNPSKRLRFEIGRPKPTNAIGFTASAPAPDRIWHHVAATWDGRRMRLYLDGLLVGSRPYAGAFTATPRPFKIGYADAGVGSLVLDVDEVAAYGRALSAVEILRDAHRDASLPQSAADAFAAADRAVAKGDWPAAAAAYERAATLRGCPPAYRALARLARVRSLRKAGRAVAAVKECERLLGTPSVSDRVRTMALFLCAPADKHAPAPLASKQVYERLLTLPGLEPGAVARVRRALAEAALREGDAAAARAQFEALLRQKGLSPRERCNLLLQIAHTYRAAGDWRRARAAYAKLIMAADAPPEFKSNAQLCIADAFLRERNYARAIEAFAKVLTLPDAPAHLRAEARERIEETKRIQRGLPPRDPKASRIKIPKFPKPAVVFYVAPDGSDANPGTRDKPFATLERARDAIRALKAKRGLPRGGATVFVRGGVYRRSSTFELTDADSGRADAPIVYRAALGETPRFLGSVRLTGFRPVRDPAVLQRLPEASRGRVFELDMKAAGVSDLGELKVRGYGFARYPTNPWVDLYVDGRPMTLARWPNEGFVKVGKVLAGRFRTKDARKPGVFQYQGDRPRRWKHAADVWLFGAWGNLWACRRIPVARIDAERRLITTGAGASYGFRQEQPYYYFNLLEEIDRPGEWYLDRAKGALYLYPPKPLDRADVEFPILNAAFVKMANVSRVTLRGLTFEFGRAEGVVILDGERDLLAGCTLRGLGANGAVILGGRGHGVLGCDLSALGAGGVRMKGGDAKTLTPGEHFVENCHIYDFSRVDRAYAPAVYADGVGLRIAHNLFHDSPHHAMRVEGYEHLIEFNEIHSVVYEWDDQGGIDMWGNPAYRGDVIRFNFWRHIGSGHWCGQAGIRLDDMISRVLVYGNVFWRCSGGRFGAIQIHGGKDNFVDNNLFVECKFAISFSPWGQKRWERMLDSAGVRTRIARRAGDITQPPHSTRYPDLAHLREHADRNFIWRNVAVNCGRFAARGRGVNEFMDNCAFVGDPGFVDLARRRLGLKSDSPIYRRLGFRPIPFEEIGLYRDEFRATWPVRSKVSPRVMQEFRWEARR